MGKVNNAIKMLFILKRRGKVKIKDLAMELEVSERHIRRYKEDLEGLFNIESTQGPDGGYRLNDDYFPFREVLIEKEINALNLAVNCIDEDLFKNNINLREAINKMNFSILKRDADLILNEQIIPFSTPKGLGIEIIKMHDEIYAAIINCYEIEIKYLANKGNITERTIRPHKYLRYKGECYLVATCLLKNQIRYFKLVRIKKYKITEDKFEKNLEIEDRLKKDRENSMGIFYGKTYDLELEINPPMSNTIRERIWVDNQQITDLENGKILFKANMNGGPELIAWILSMADTVRIIKPESLRVEVKEKLNNMLKII